MSPKNELPAQADSKKAAETMHEAIGKTIAQKKHEPIGTGEAEREVADNLKRAAEADTKRRG